MMYLIFLPEQIFPHSRSFRIEPTLLSHNVTADVQFIKNHLRSHQHQCKNIIIYNSDKVIIQTQTYLFVE